MAPQIVTTQPAARGRGCKDFRDSIVGIPHGASNLYVAYSVVTAFPDRTPSWKELSSRFGMDRATAYRHRAVLKAIRGEF